MTRGSVGGISRLCQPRPDSSICPENQNLVVWGETLGGLEDIMGVRWGSGSISIQVLKWCVDFGSRYSGVGALASPAERSTCSSRSRLPPSLPCPRPASGQPWLGQ